MGDTIRTRSDAIAQLALLRPESVLQVGGHPWWLAAELSAVARSVVAVDCDRVQHATPRNPAIELVHSTPQAIQLDRRFDLVIVGDLAQYNEADTRAVLHASVQHCAPRGHVAVLWEHVPPSEQVYDFGLQLVEDHVFGVGGMSMLRRPDRFTVHDLVFEARASIARVSPDTLFQALRSARPPLVLDTRTHTDRTRFGVIEPSVHVPRTVLEWHLDPSNGYLHPSVRSFDDPIVVVCNGGYSSSLAAANLVRLGYTAVADLIGGHAAWIHAGLPVGQPDHSHLDY